MSKGRMGVLFAGLFAIAGGVAATRWVQANSSPATVPPNTVCMMNNMVMGGPQTPVEIAGKTYFACCPDCVRRLENEVEVRMAVDPETGRQVDKASAVILQGEGGAALYFESLESATRFARARPAT